MDDYNNSVKNLAKTHESGNRFNNNNNKNNTNFNNSNYKNSNSNNNNSNLNQTDKTVNKYLFKCFY
jgi:hypothetical protein